MDKAYSHRVGTHMAWLRKQKKMTQEQLAARMQLLGCDITRSAIAKIEVGQRMLCPDEIKALHSVLDVSYDDILL
jgi:transcriptional regulator with XRE-family HTH domain